ncbi:MAG: pilus assembly protein [Bryobacterales bacterium]|nr:pilus assembly protein [Bryobacterales bacterium]
MASCKRLRSGSALIELALAVPVMALLVMGAVDFARVFYMSVEVTSAARAAAIFGSRSTASVDDTAGISLAATRAAPEVPSLTVTPAKLCGCSDGTVADCTSVSCTPKYTYIRVQTQATFTTTCPYPGIPSSIPVSAVALMRAQ